ncbi:hypothetical protein ACWD4K_35040 [Streptomyces gelaticus]
MSVVIYTDFIDTDRGRSLDDLEITIVESLNESMERNRGNAQFLPPPPQGSTATDVALRTIRMLREAQDRMEEQRTFVRYYCDRCHATGCRFSRRTLEDVRHSPVQFIAMVLIRLAEAVRLMRNLPATREVLTAALVARNAAVEGDTETVDAFSRDWLGLTDPQGWRSAVENALLGEWVHHLGRGVLRDPQLRDLLNQHTRIEHRNLQPLWERRVRGRRVRLLQDLIADGLTLADTVADNRRPEDALLRRELDDSRLAAVFRGLTQQEAEVAAAWAADPKSTWLQAAAALGHREPASFGERVRRKLKRLGAVQVERAAATGVAR